MATLQEDPNYGQLMRALGMQDAEAQSARDLAITRSTNQYGIDRAQVDLDERELGVQRGELGLQRSGTRLDQRELGLSRQGTALDREQVGLNLADLSRDRDRLGLRSQGLGLDRQETVIQGRAARRRITDDRESRGLLQSSRTRNLLAEQRQLEGLDQQRLGLSERGLQLDRGSLDTQEQRYGLDDRRLLLQNRRYNVADERLGLESASQDLADTRLGISQDRLGQRRGAADLQFAYGVQDATLGYNRFAADQAVRQAEQALQSGSQLYLEELLRNA